MSSWIGRSIAGIVVVAGLVWLGLAVRDRLVEQQRGPQAREKSRAPVPVEVAAIERGPIARERTFSGTLESPSITVLAPKIAGRIEQLHYDVGDDIERGAVVAVLDDDEPRQAVAQAQADLEVARAYRAEAASALEIAERGLLRVQQLKGTGVASDLQVDAAQSEALARRAQLEVAEAQVSRADATLETSRIRLGYTQVSAGWSAGDAAEGSADASRASTSTVRTVATRHVQEGDTVSANSPLLTAVVLDPLLAVINVGERDFSWLQTGQTARLVAEAYPTESFEGRIVRIAPRFDTASRQVRVELVVPNPGRRLLPGMFVRTTIVLERAPEATIVPALALTRRADHDGVFCVDEATQTARWVEVTPGIRQGDRVQVTGNDLSGRVICLGQHMLDHGSAVVVPDNSAATVANPEPGAAREAEPAAPTGPPR